MFVYFDFRFEDQEEEYKDSEMNDAKNFPNIICFYFKNTTWYNSDRETPIALKLMYLAVGYSAN